MKLAFIGLGVMGYPMAGHLARAGHEVTVYNRTRAKADKWVKEHGGLAVATPRAAAQRADIVFSCVGNDHDLRAVTLGADGAFAGMKKSAIYVDHSTVSANVARELEQQARGAGFGFLDAPVSGGQAGAEKGILTVMVGGDAQAFADAQAGDGALRARGDADGSRPARPAHENGEPDYDRRAGAVAGRRAQLRDARRARRERK